MSVTSNTLPCDQVCSIVKTRLLFVLLQNNYSCPAMPLNVTVGRRNRTGSSAILAIRLRGVSRIEATHLCFGEEQLQNGRYEQSSVKESCLYVPFTFLTAVAMMLLGTVVLRPMTSSLRAETAEAAGLSSIRNGNSIGDELADCRPSPEL